MIKDVVVSKEYMSGILAGLTVEDKFYADVSLSGLPEVGDLRKDVFGALYVVKGVQILERARS